MLIADINDRSAIEGVGGLKAPSPSILSEKVNASVLPESLPSQIELNESDQSEADEGVPNKQKNYAKIFGVMLIAIFASIFLSK